MQTQGSLQESNLASLLQTMQSERATGTLTVENGSDNAALYFLFGHLFHASGPGGEGEDVVIRALGWSSGSFHFDPRAKLPAEETIKSSPAELISAAESSAHGSDAEPAGAEPEADLEPAGAHSWSTASEQHAPEPAWTPTVTSTPEPAGWNAPTAPAAETVPAYKPAEYTPSYTPAPVTTSAAPAAQQATGGATSAQAVGSLPIPDGTVQYEGLKSAFVDFPRLLRTLRSDKHTGYIRLSTQSGTGVLLFREGELVEAEAGENGAAHGEAAFQIFRRDMDTGQGLIDVVDLDADTVSALAKLLTGPPLYTGLLGRFINFEALLEYLAEEKLDGSLVVTGGSDTGVILLRQGSILAAYTSRQTRPQTSADSVGRLAGEKPARIEVRGSDSGHADIDTEAALSRPY